VICN